MEASKDELTGRWSLTGVEPSEVTFERICKMLLEGENFKFARYGDGEFNCMFGKIGRNCDGHEYFPDLGMALNDAFYSDPEYMVGIQPLSVQGGMYQKAVMQRDGSPKNIYDADALHSASIDGRWGGFIESLEDRNVIVVGPSHLFALGKAYPKTFLGRRYILIPNKNCWLQYAQTVSDIGQLIKENDVILLAASMMSEVILTNFVDFNATFIDIGSVMDPYCNVLSRRYHHKLQNLNGKMEKN